MDESSKVPDICTQVQNSSSSIPSLNKCNITAALSCLPGTLFSFGGAIKTLQVHHRTRQVSVYLVVSAGGVERVGAAGEQGLVVSRHQHFDIVVALVLKQQKQASFITEWYGAIEYDLYKEACSKCYWRVVSQTLSLVSVKLKVSTLLIYQDCQGWKCLESHSNNRWYNQENVICILDSVFL